MPQIIKGYTLDELSNENKAIILDTQEGVRIHIEFVNGKTQITFPFGNKFIKTEWNHLIVIPEQMP